jgi:hypothetical protein
VLHFPRQFFLISVRAQERTEGFLSADFSAQSHVFSPTLLGESFLVSVRCASAKPIGEVLLPQFVRPGLLSVKQFTRLLGFLPSRLHCLRVFLCRRPGTDFCLSRLLHDEASVVLELPDQKARCFLVLIAFKWLLLEQTRKVFGEITVMI